MSHKFDDRQFKKLESPERLRVLPPQEVIMHLDLEKGSVVSDVGCGIGYFSFPLADVVGIDGRVIATDISEIMVNELKNRVDQRGYKNIDIIRSTESDMGIDDNSVDLFFASTLIHELDDLDSFTRLSLKKLKQNGRIAYLDFEKKETGFGPDVEKRISSEYLIEMFIDLGLKDINRYEIGDAFYLIIARIDN